MLPSAQEGLTAVKGVFEAEVEAMTGIEREDRMQSWRRPSAVIVRPNELVTAFSGETYQLAEAADEALSELIGCRSSPDVVDFTLRWGFLYERFRDGEPTDSFPLELFRGWRNWIFSLAQLATKLRRGTPLRESLNLFRKHKASLEEALGCSTTEEDCLGLQNAGFGSVRSAEPLLSSGGDPQRLKEEAGGILRAELCFQMSLRVELVVHETGVTPVSVPRPATLLHSVLLSFHERLSTMDCRRCFNCGRAFLVRRGNPRFCQPSCRVKSRSATPQKSKRGGRPEKVSERSASAAAIQDTVAAKLLLRQFSVRRWNERWKR